MKIALVVFGLVALCVSLALLFGRSRWQAGTRNLRSRILAGQLKTETTHYDSREIIGLPVPVRRYFETVLADGQPLIRSVELAHEGTFNMGQKEAQWRPFRSTQLNLMQRVGFDWDGSIAMMPGLPVFVHDAYVGGEGILEAELLGLFRLARVRGTPEAAEGELMRFLAEGPWYPTRLLPSQGIEWTPINEKSARATLVDGATKCSLEFHFGEDGCVEKVRADARYRTVGDKLEAAPWEGRFWNYQSRSGMRVPLEGEVSWMLPNGAWPYWRGRLTKLNYQFAGR
jgi:hypothetical protein